MSTPTETDKLQNHLPERVKALLDPDGDFVMEIFDHGLNSSYLTFFDPDGMFGVGLMGHSPDPAHALRFKGFKEVLELWQMQGTVTPTRPDGKPNRPLTALLVSPKRLPKTININIK